MQNISCASLKPHRAAGFRPLTRRLKPGRAAFTIFILMYLHPPSNQAKDRSPKRCTLLLCGLVVALLLALPAQAAGSKAQNRALPVFDINKTEYHFGDRFVGEELIARFTVRNLGAAPLMLSETPVLSTSPTVGLYRALQSEGRRQLKEWLQPASLRGAALPYT